MAHPSPEQIIRGHQAAVAMVRAKVLGFAQLAWTAQGSYRDADIDRLVALIVPRVQAGQIRVANLTAAYIAALAGVPAVPVDPRDILGGRGVDPSEVYRRPATQVYTALAGGKSFADAVASGLVRLQSLASTDMQMASVRQARSSMGHERVVGFRRVLTGAENCALCAIASSQRYHRESLMPIHPGCDCGVAPILADSDPGRVINQPLLDATHDQIADFAGRTDLSGRDLGRDKATSSGQRVSDFTDLIVTREHGEYGATLAWRSDRFTGPADI